MGFSEKDCCIKCDKGGKLLSCSDSSCPIAVHEKCMRIKAKFDEKGNFYCPYCLYRRVTEELHQAREKAVSGKKALSSFIDLDMVTGDTLAHGTRRLEGKETRQSPETGKENDVQSYGYSGLQLNEVNVQQNHVQLNEDKEKTGPECTTTASPSNGVDMLSANAGTGDCINRLMLVGHQTLSGRVVACGNDDTCSEEEGTAQQFELVKIGVDKLQHHNQLAFNHVKSVDHSEEHRFEESSEAGKLGSGNEFCCSIKNAGTDAKPSEKNEGTAARVIEMEDENQLEDHRIGDSLGAGNDLSSPAKDVKCDAKPSDENVEVSAGKEETEEQAEESISSFDSDVALPLQYGGRRQTESSEVRDSEPNSAGKHVRHNTAIRGPIDGLRRSSRNRSSKLRPIPEQMEDNSPSNEFKKRKQHSTELPRNLPPSLRRKKLPWSEDEVEMLQEGVQKFSTTVNKNIPWRKILEFGRHVFHGTRNPQDLKDKWRNVLPKEK